MDILNYLKQSLLRATTLAVLLVFQFLASTAAFADVTRIITDAVGNESTWVYQENLSTFKLISKTNAVDSKGLVNTYDLNNNLTTTTNAEGNQTSYSYNATNQRQSMTEALGTPEARITTYEYESADIDLIKKITTESVLSGSSTETIITYDASLNPVLITKNGFKPDATPISRSSAITYNSLGQVLTIDGPRTDVADITTFTYYNCTTGFECGHLQSSTNAAGHITTYDNYNSGGLLTQSTDANGLVTTYDYDLRQRLISITLTPIVGDARVTSYTYDNIGQITQINLPYGLVITNTYNDARYLSSIEDNLGNRVEYEYDLKGNRIQTEFKDFNSTLERSTNAAFDHRNFTTTLSNINSIATIVVDAVGKATSETDPNNNPSNTNQFDGLERLKLFTDSIGGQTQFSYSVQDQLTQVISANSAATQFIYDDLENRLSETSSDRGVTLYEHDSAGNMVSRTDARDVILSYSYDVLNRLTQILDASSNPIIEYEYDTCTNGKGRVCVVMDASGETLLDYDIFGNILSVSKTQTVFGNNQVYQTSYTYDAADRVTQIIYPSGRVVDYTYDARGKVTLVASDTQILLNNLDFRADGQLREQTYGNGAIEVRTYDAQARLEEIKVDGARLYEYSYDNNSNILGFTGISNQSQTYDALDRLDTESGISTTLDYDYDSNGNRTNLSQGANQSALVYQSNSNLLLSFDSDPFQTDAAGNIVDYQNKQLSYNELGQLERLINQGMTVDYAYDASWQRTRKRYGSWLSDYQYDLQGRLISISDGAGQIQLEYIYASEQAVNPFVRIKHVSSNIHTVEAGLALFPTPDNNVSFSCNALASQSLQQSSSVSAPSNKTAVVSKSLNPFATQSIAATSTPMVMDKKKPAKKKNNKNKKKKRKKKRDKNKPKIPGSDLNTATSTPFSTPSAKTASSASSTSQALVSAQLQGFLPVLYFLLLGSEDFVLLDDVINLDQSINQTLNTDQASFLWDEVDGASEYVIAIGTNPNDLAQGEGSGVTSYCVNDAKANIMNLTPNAINYIRVWALVNGEWQYKDYIINRDQTQSNQTELLYLLQDHLGTPRQAMDENNNTVWQWNSDGFGTTSPNEDVDNNGQVTQINLRFAGQYYDQESELHYNWHRYYDSAIGRYITSDPIGLSGGLNSYEYVVSNPQSYIDTDGLEPYLPLDSIIFNAYSRVGGGIADYWWTNPAAIIGAGIIGIGRLASSKLVRSCAVSAAKSASSRAKQIHSALDPRAQRMRTTAVTETQEGVRVISSSNRRLSPAQRAQLGRNEVEGVGVGHAEVTGVNAARNMGLNPTGTAASRPICPNCARTLADEGVSPLSPLK